MKFKQLLLTSLCSFILYNPVSADNPASPAMSNSNPPFFSESNNSGTLPPLLQTNRPQNPPSTEPVLFAPKQDIASTTEVQADKLMQQTQGIKAEIELLRLIQEKEQAIAEKDPALQKKRSELMRLTLEKDYLTAENSLQEAKRQQQQNELLNQKQKLELENAIAAEKQKQEIADLDRERALLAAQNALQEERNKQLNLGYDIEQSRLRYELAKLEYEQAVRNHDTGLLEEKLKLRTQLEDWKKQVNEPIEYREEPMVNGELFITDRRIDLNGPILPGSADYISERIHFFNNKDAHYPIFLVIENSAGGSVMEGMQILKAMQSSDAPVFVVVKSFAASMTAIIAALAERSYAYPNAIILHHQIWSISLGNAVQQKEALALMQEWNQRAMLPVAQKMGLSLEQFIEAMYKHNSEGNWRAFASEAVDLKWIDQTVSTIKELSYTVNPDTLTPPIPPQQGVAISMSQQSNLQTQIDKEGKHYQQLPSLQPLDVYFLYNPDNYYRW